MTLPLITIVMTTYLPEGEEGGARLSAIYKTLSSWEYCLVYNGSIDLLVVNDGVDERVDHLHKYYIQDWRLGDFQTSQLLGRGGVGRSLNDGFKKSFRLSPLVLYAVDDWSLTQDFDLTPWAQLLMEREDVGMVRLGPPHPGNTGHVEAFTGNWQGWAMRLAPRGFAFGHRPALYHQRFIQKWGWFDENCSALECERLYNERWCQEQKITAYQDGEYFKSDIVYALPHPWQHLASVELSSMEPGNAK